ncbi:hypothetical protein DFJ74DRAFT_765151 [Hyaloraphidium curvatum]|nr:hypothetical protein DFJ74DRAFT_765151 [Hyaloraphidium curvatum]
MLLSEAVLTATGNTPAHGLLHSATSRERRERMPIAQNPFERSFGRVVNTSAAEPERSASNAASNGAANAGQFANRVAPQQASAPERGNGSPAGLAPAPTASHLRNTPFRDLIGSYFDLPLASMGSGGPPQSANQQQTGRFQVSTGWTPFLFPGNGASMPALPSAGGMAGFGGIGQGSGLTPLFFPNQSDPLAAALAMTTADSALRLQESEAFEAPDDDDGAMGARMSAFTVSDATKMLQDKQAISDAAGASLAQLLGTQSRQGLEQPWGATPSPKLYAFAIPSSPSMSQSSPFMSTSVNAVRPVQPNQPVSGLTLMGSPVPLRRASEPDERRARLFSRRYPFRPVTTLMGLPEETADRGGETGKRKYSLRAHAEHAAPGTSGHAAAERVQHAPKKVKIAAKAAEDASAQRRSVRPRKSLVPQLSDLLEHPDFAALSDSSAAVGKPGGKKKKDSGASGDITFMEDLQEEIKGLREVNSRMRERLRELGENVDETFPEDAVSSANPPDADDEVDADGKEDGGKEDGGEEGGGKGELRSLGFDV